MWKKSFAFLEKLGHFLQLFKKVRKIMVENSTLFLRLPFISDRHRVTYSIWCLDSQWHSGRLCSFFCGDLLSHAGTEDQQRIVIYLTTSYAGFPFLVMGVCYSLIYYQVLTLKY